MKIKKKWLITIPVIVALLVFAGLYYYFNRVDENSFTVAENKWIKNNSKKIVDFEIINDYPVYGESGVFKTFINQFSEDTNLEFNIIPYFKENNPNGTGYRFRVLKNNEQLTENDILLQEDVYVLIGKEKGRVSDIKELGSKVIGILSTDSEEILYYLKAQYDLKYKTYDKIDELFKEYEENKTDYIIIPNIMYLDKTIENESYNIKMILTELNRKIVLTLSEKDSYEMNNIVRKYFNSWKDKKFVSTYNSKMLDYYINKTNINDKERAEFLTKNYVYGYVENYPYEVKDKENLSGIAAEYVNRMMRLANTDFITFKKYKNIDELKKAIEGKEVDIYFNYFDYEDQNYNATISPFIERYAVLGRVKDKHVVTSFESLKSKNASILTTNSVYNFFRDNGKASLKPFETLKDMLNKSGENVLVLDYELYNYYRSSKLEDYELLYVGEITNEYNFLVNKEQTNNVFYKIFNYIIGTNSYYNYRNAGLSSLNMSIIEKSTFEELYITILTIILLPLAIVGLLYVILRKTKKVKKVKKEERRKYSDLLTSLKNRNYLNYSMKAWNENKKYPQAIIMIDLNNVKYVNDNYGHEKGDKLIVDAAGILINSQLENSEIIRSDGNEFLIYLVGYSDSQVSTYTKKLAKEFKNLSYGFGAAIGYSMIMDDIKTIDDAINEATEKMRKDKEEYK